MKRIFKRDCFLKKEVKFVVKHHKELEKNEDLC